MKPIIPNPKEPWKICPKQLADLDNFILHIFSNAKLCEGIKYGRWATLEGSVTFGFPDSHMDYWPDNVFRGKMCGQEQTILMWLPFFD